MQPNESPGSVARASRPGAFAAAFTLAAEVSAVGIIAALPLLAACGQKGPLTLPAPAPVAASPSGAASAASASPAAGSTR
jgi:predicted small lipoprotein YifL